MALLRIAMVGYGAVAGEHAEAIQHIDNATLAAVIGPRLEKAQRFAAAHGDPPVFSNLQAAIGATQIDATVITSPTPLHALHAREAVAAGLHVLVEFPWYSTAKEMNELIRSAGRFGRVIATAHTSRWIWSFARVKTLIESRSLGRCRSIAYVRLIDRPAGTGTSGESRNWNDDVLLHHAAHVIDLCKYWFNNRVTLVDVVAPAESCGRRNCGLLLRGDSIFPIIASLTYDSFYPAIRAVLTMERGVIEIHGFARLQVNGVDDTLGRPTSEQDAYHDAIACQDMAFIAAARGEEPFPVSPNDSMQLAKLISEAVDCAKRHDPPRKLPQHNGG